MNNRWSKEAVTENVAICVVRPSVAARLALGIEAQRRGMKVETLVNKIVEVIAGDKLFKAVLGE